MNDIRRKLGKSFDEPSGKYVEFIGNTDDGRTVSCNFDPQRIAGFTHERPPTGNVVRVVPGMGRGSGRPN